MGISRDLPPRTELLFSVSDPDPDSIRTVGPDLYSKSGSGSGSRRIKITHKRRKNLEISCFEVLDVLFSELKASFVSWTSFMEA